MNTKDIVSYERFLLVFGLVGTVILSLGNLIGLPIIGFVMGSFYARVQSLKREKEKHDRKDDSS